jgi:hypothetical protein
LPTPAGGEIVFIGGGNDDLFYRPVRVAQTVSDLATVLRVTMQPVEATYFETLFDQINQRVVGTIPEQVADIEAIARCARDGGRRFRFVHDFLVYDLDHGRSPSRQLTFDARRVAALGAGADFVDLMSEFRRRAGVSWFHDFIHPSGVGQQQIADLLCARFAGDAAPRADVAEPVPAVR